uniref:t-SNARE coiled-coil homology domain-containing protein n=1 Tax=Odontella aurita TaxID=265563 RepID=A0A7S4IM31_9STRA|mmetsp:Transcript_27080/g.80052  ORF Transcript_27080/g.80052 Transcript_27080/m.80052 type:complete len:135 (+) Transcript_27080:481-885(+)|eukprot:CAMPEP_0113546080 /NCGR_PEP_ID=MMETSP0015_2-20120614/11612_1 /TAXON_ID=2838 /ORGANISM="Odontella" /LENGTH=134 /DNA_ID=CAMNT_0000446505 /DNA_START=463 /DNA_END=867 /DNA_ORIENTATION=- /assembly_acc=CAM_ASM_000160
MFGNSRGARGKGKYRQVPHHDYSDSDSDEADDFISQQVRNQRLQMKRQDEGLEMLGQSADRLGQLSMNIHEELGQQNKLLDEMEDDLDQATTRLDFVTQKTRELVQRSGGKKNFLIIVGLTIVVIILIFLIIYT